MYDTTTNSILYKEREDVTMKKIKVKGKWQYFDGDRRITEAEKLVFGDIDL